MQSSLQAWASRFAAALAALCTAPAVVALCGGADLDLPFARVSWFDAAGPTLAALAAALASIVRPRPASSALRTRVAAVFWATALLSLAVAAWAATLGGFQSAGFSARHAASPALVGAASMLVAVALARGIARSSFVPAVLAVVIGTAAASLALYADRLDLREQIARLGDRAAVSETDVLFIVVDTLRADAVGFAADGANAATPEMDALAAESVVFEAAFSQAPWTLPSMMSLVTGRYASSLHPSWRGAWPTRVPLEAGPSVLAEALRGAGYHTAGFVKNPMLAAGTGFERGYDVYEWVGGEDADGHSARQLVDATLRWADEFAEGRRAKAHVAPFFLSVHFMDPHAHYRPPRAFWSEEARRYAGDFDGHASTLRRMTEPPAVPTAADIEQMRRLYRDEVRYFDSQLGRLLASLRALGLVDATTLIVLTSDHGEQFGEHGGFEHRDIYIENVHVPLLMRVPGEPGRRVSQPIGLIDVAPTLLDWLDLPELPGAQGRSRRASLHGDAVRSTPVVTEFGAALRATSAGRSVVRDGQGATRFYDRERDAREQRDLAGSDTSRFEMLLRALDRHEAQIARADRGAPGERGEPGDPDRGPKSRVELPEAERLKALGYSN